MHQTNKHIWRRRIHTRPTNFVLLVQFFPDEGHGQPRPASVQQHRVALHSENPLTTISVCGVLPHGLDPTLEEMVITVTLQLRGGFQPVKIPTKPFDGVKLADDGQPSLICATFRACGNKRCRLPASTCGSERRKWYRLALGVVIQCPTSADRPMSNEGSVRDFAEDTLTKCAARGARHPQQTEQPHW